MNREKISQLLSVSFSCLVAAAICLGVVAYLCQEMTYMSSQAPAALLGITAMASLSIFFGAGAIVCVSEARQEYLRGKNKLPKLLKA